ncbi:carboxymuconolactone decarboxylase family protein [Virgibacillus sp. 179-BFC.A HS]|uniref:Carboxymuconolactone decarboxylase family protein n=1 Tax=Tigheibacillus jepli TaxID=3035914 RepID=A0ABU5CKU5_9BACI|nr:carboxymuconolactone decarboxylase family protein [Virgibacillus sp. 179-BFC.A HS]MDY0406439.1 carboxymuconolactone decarboxylase family protein [Virgibacillus sp. 179-BFC.A HS]
MSTSLYTKETVKNLSQAKELAPEQWKAFDEFGKSVFEEGALSRKEKEIVAIAITHITQCPYCIDTHTKNAKKPVQRWRN